MTTVVNDIPVHAPPFPPDPIHGADDAEAVSVLGEVVRPNGA